MSLQIDKFNVLVYLYGNAATQAFTRLLLLLLLLFFFFIIIHFWVLIGCMKSKEKELQRGGGGGGLRDKASFLYLSKRAQRGF